MNTKLFVYLLILVCLYGHVYICICVRVCVSKLRKRLQYFVSMYVAADQFVSLFMDMCVYVCMDVPTHSVNLSCTLS